MERARDIMKREEGGLPLLFLLKTLLIAYILTGALLLLLALFVYRFRLSEKTVSLVIIGIYIATTFLAGFTTGKKLKTKKFLWGLLIGFAYFVVLAILSLIVNHSMGDMGSNVFSVLVMCAGSGMLGGMVS